jgi:2-oxoisovalerate dehydrogenase E1 component
LGGIGPDTLSNNSEISADLLDLRTLQPLDTEAIFESVKKTGRVIIYQEDSMFGGVASDGTHYGGML